MPELVHPDDDPRFAGSPNDYPGGRDAYWGDWDAANLAIGHESLMKTLDPAERRAYRRRQATYALRREVTNMVKALAREVGHDSRTISIWLVKQHGFPWRQQCDRSDLYRLRQFLLDPEVRAEAATIEPAPPRRLPLD